MMQSIESSQWWYLISLPCKFQGAVYAFTDNNTSFFINKQIHTHRYISSVKCFEQKVGYFHNHIPYHILLTNINKKRNLYIRTVSFYYNLAISKVKMISSMFNVFNQRKWFGVYKDLVLFERWNQKKCIYFLIAVPYCEWWKSVIWPYVPLFGSWYTYRVFFVVNLLHNFIGDIYNKAHFSYICLTYISTDTRF